MNMNRIAIGTIVGTITLYVVGYVIFQLLWASYYEANISSTRGANLQWAALAGNLCYALLVTLALETRAGAQSLGKGFLTGAIIGYLSWLGAHFAYYANTEVITYNILIVDPLNEFVHTGIAGAVITAVLARMPGSVPAQPSV